MWSKHSDQRLIVSANLQIVSMDVQEELFTAPLHRQGFLLKLRISAFWRSQLTARIVHMSVLAIFLLLFQDSSNTYWRAICGDTGLCSLFEESHDWCLCQLPFDRLENLFFRSAPFHLA